MDLTPGVTGNIVLKDLSQIPEDCPLPLESFRMFSLREGCTKKEGLPFFQKFHKSIRCMTWNINRWAIPEDQQKSDDQKSDDYKSDGQTDEIPVFSQCQLLSLNTASSWDDTLKMNDKFPSLKWLNISIDDGIHKWDESLFDKLQSFLSSQQETLSVFQLDLNLHRNSKNTKQYNKVFMDQNMLFVNSVKTVNVHMSLFFHNP